VLSTVARELNAKRKDIGEREAERLKDEKKEDRRKGQ